MTMDDAKEAGMLVAALEDLDELQEEVAGTELEDGDAMVVEVWVGDECRVGKGISLTTASVLAMLKWTEAHMLLRLKQLGVETPEA